MRTKRVGTATKMGVNEADINYNKGKRNRQRILYSNDGLIFATYDHYQTFYEIAR